MRALAEPFVVAAPTGGSTPTIMHVTAVEHEVLVAVAEHLGRLASKDLAGRCKLGKGPKHKGRAERKRVLTPHCSSRWAGTITRRSADMWERQKLNYIDVLADKRAAVNTITERLKKPVGEGGYGSKQIRFAKQQRLQVLQQRVVRLEDRLATGRMSIVRGGRDLLNHRNNLQAAGLTEPQWREMWDAARWFITADGDSSYQWGNGLVSVDADTGIVAVTLPTPLKHLANAARGRFVFAAPVVFNHRGDEWAAQASTGSVAYDIAYDPDKQRWYLIASWKIPKTELPSLHQLRQLPTLAVDLNADHIAGWVIAPDGNPVGDPITIAYTSKGTTGQNSASLRHALKQLLDIARVYGCGSIACEDLNFADARATGRETMGTGKRGKQFRQTVSSIPTAKFRDLLVSMAYKTGITIIAVDPAYTSQWGREHWHKELNDSRRTPSSTHHVAAVVIGRRALGLKAKRKSNIRDGTTSTRQRTEQQCKQRAVARRSRVSQRSQPAQGTTPRKRGNTSSAQPRTVRGAQTNWEQQQQQSNGVVETRTRKPITLQRQDTATVQGARPAVNESQLLPTN